MPTFDLTEFEIDNYGDLVSKDGTVKIDYNSYTNNVANNVWVRIEEDDVKRVYVDDDFDGIIDSYHEYRPGFRYVEDDGGCILDKNQKNGTTSIVSYLNFSKTNNAMLYNFTSFSNEDWEYTDENSDGTIDKIVRKDK